jgi:hypothetical protein
VTITVQDLKNVTKKVWEELMKQSRCRLVFKICWKNYYIELDVIFSKNVWTLPESHMHIFNVSITTMQCLKNVSLMVWEELFTQSRCHLFKTCWKNDYACNFFLRNVLTLPKSYMHIFIVSITTLQSLKNIICQPKGVRGVDYTMKVPFIKMHAHLAFTIP